MFDLVLYIEADVCSPTYCDKCRRGYRTYSPGGEQLHRECFYADVPHDLSPDDIDCRGRVINFSTFLLPCSHPMHNRVWTFRHLQVMPRTQCMFKQHLNAHHQRRRDMRQR